MTVIFNLNLRRKRTGKNTKPRFGGFHLIFVRETEKFAKEKNGLKYWSRIVPNTSEYGFKSAEYRKSLPHIHQD